MGLGEIGRLVFGGSHLLRRKTKDAFSVFSNHLVDDFGGHCRIHGDFQTNAVLNFELQNQIRR